MIDVNKQISRMARGQSGESPTHGDHHENYFHTLRPPGLP